MYCSLSSLGSFWNYNIKSLRLGRGNPWHCQEKYLSKLLKFATLFAHRLGTWVAVPYSVSIHLDREEEWPVLHCYYTGALNDHTQIHKKLNIMNMATVVSLCLWSWGIICWRITPPCIRVVTFTLYTRKEGKKKWILLWIVLDLHSHACVFSVNTPASMHQTPKQHPPHGNPACSWPHHHPTSARLHLQDRTDMVAQVGDSWRVRGAKVSSPLWHVLPCLPTASASWPLSGLLFSFVKNVGVDTVLHKVWATQMFYTDAKTTGLEIFI